MSGQRHIVMPSDVFPPKCGGAGWSAHALATALLAQGAQVTAVVPRADGHAGSQQVDVAGVPTVVVHHQHARSGLLRQLLRMVVVVPALRAQIRLLLHPRATTIVHAQHILAAQAALPLRTKRTRVVITVRDHWPWDMHATGMQMAGDQRTVRGVWRTLQLRGASWGARLLAPLYAWQMRHRATLIARADLVIAVSAHMAARLRALVPTANVHAVPNMVDVDAIQACVSTPPRVQVPAQYVLFVGKLSPNKGAQYLPELIRRIRPPAIVIAGDGPLQAAIVAAAADAAVPCVVLDWVDHDDVLRLMAGCQALWFPSSWDEPLSRVLLEALACGAPIIAMPTGGTPEIIIDGTTGLLATTLDAFVGAADRLAGDSVLAAQLRANSLQHARHTYAQDVVIARMLAHYDAIGAQS